MPRLSQKLEQKQKLAPRQVLQARLLQLNTLNLEQAILKELELKFCHLQSFQEYL